MNESEKKQWLDCVTDMLNAGINIGVHLHKHNGSTQPDLFIHELKEAE